MAHKENQSTLDKHVHAKYASWRHTDFIDLVWRSLWSDLKGGCMETYSIIIMSYSEISHHVWIRQLDWKLSIYRPNKNYVQGV